MLREHGIGAWSVFWVDAQANSSGLKSLVISSSDGVGIFQRSVNSLFSSLADARFLTSYTLFFTSCDAIELAEMGQGRDDRLFLPVRLFNVFHANRVECVKSTVLTASVLLSRRFSSK